MVTGEKKVSAFNCFVVNGQLWFEGEHENKRFVNFPCMKTDALKKSI